MYYSPDSRIAWLSGACRRADARVIAAIDGALDAIIDAPALDRSRLFLFAGRSIYPKAARQLDSYLIATKHSGSLGGLVGILIERQDWRVRPMRLALLFRVRSLEDLHRLVEPFTADDLRAIAKHNDTYGKRAREALAALGECDWPNATRRERAAFVLTELVRLHLGGAP